MMFFIMKPNIKVSFGISGVESSSSATVQFYCTGEEKMAQVTQLACHLETKTIKDCVPSNLLI
jgi:hypothetical protein